MLEKIEKLLGEELAKKVEKKLGDVELAIMNDGTVVPVRKYKGLEENLKDLEAKYEEANADDGTKAELERLQKEYADYKGEVLKDKETSTKTSKLMKELKKAGFVADAIDLIVKEFNMEDVKLENDEIVDAEKLISPIKEKRKSLIVQEKIKGEEPKDKQTAGQDGEYKPVFGRTRR